MWLYFFKPYPSPRLYFQISSCLKIRMTKRTINISCRLFAAKTGNEMPQKPEKHLFLSLKVWGGTPRFIDEWQDISVIWDAVRMAVDERGSVVIDEKRKEREVFRRLHTGTCRISAITMSSLLDIWGISTVMIVNINNIYAFKLILTYLYEFVTWPFRVIVGLYHYESKSAQNVSFCNGGVILFNV